MSPDQEGPDLSYYDANLQLVRNYAFSEKPPYSTELLAAFLTIRDFKMILFKVDTDLTEVLNEDFIRDILRPDLNKVVLILGDYSGEDRTGIDDASEFIDLALGDIYFLQDLIVNPPAKKVIKTKKTRSNLPIYIRNNIRSAYRALEHLKKPLDAIIQDKSKDEDAE